ncbi:bud site selection protein [Rhodotorula toruloides]
MYVGGGRPTGAERCDPAFGVPTTLIHPTVVSKALFKLIRTHGLAKVSYTLVSMNVPQAILKQIMQGWFQFAQNFRVEGSDF